MIQGIGQAFHSMDCVVMKHDRTRSFDRQNGAGKMVSISLYAFQGVKQVILYLTDPSLQSSDRLRSGSLHFDSSLIVSSDPRARQRASSMGVGCF